MSLVTTILLPTAPCRAQPAPQAEVAGEKTPVRLTLSVYKTTVVRRQIIEERTDWDRIKRDFPEGRLPDNASPELIEKYMKNRIVKVGEPLWIKIRITNVGKKMFTVGDDFFQGSKDFGEILEKNVNAGVAVYVELTGPDGKKIKWSSAPFFDGYCLNGFLDKSEPPLNETSSGYPGLLERLSDWKKSGHKIHDLVDVWYGKRPPPPQKKQEDADLFRLKPSQSFTTHSWIYRPICNGERPRMPKPIGDYAELEPLHMDKPGEYRLKAIYDMLPTTLEIAYNKQHGGHLSEEEIRVETPPIKITVRP